MALSSNTVSHSALSSALEKGRKTLGFTTQSGFRKFLALSIPFTIFIAVNSPFLDVDNGFCGPDKNAVRPRAGSCYWYMHPVLKRYKWSLFIHLATIFPAGLLAVLQFIPKLRQRYPAVHRWTGRLILGLGIPGIWSVPFLLDRAFGGGFDGRSSSIFLCGLTTWAFIKAWTTARARKFDEHRRWATRSWVWLGCVVTHRIAMGAFAAYVSLNAQKLVTAIPCPEVWTMVENEYGPGLEAQVAWSKYPACSGFASNGTGEERHGLVYGDLLNGKLEEKAAALHLVFGSAFWVAIVIHVAATEIYFGRKGGRGTLGRRPTDGTEGPGQLVDDKGVKTL